MSRSSLGCTAVLLAATALVTGCGSSQTPAEAQSSTPKGSNVCKDAKSDARTNDLTSVALKRDGDFLNVTWTMVKRDTGVGTADFFLIVSNENDSTAGHLGVKYLDGRQVSYFTSIGTNKEISGSAQVTANSVTASFPMSDLEQIGPNFEWQGTTTRNGNGWDTCPGVGSAHPRFAGQS
jgi:hypothetical protein